MKESIASSSAHIIPTVMQQQGVTRANDNLQEGDLTKGGQSFLSATKLT